MSWRRALPWMLVIVLAGALLGTQRPDGGAGGGTGAGGTGGGSIDARAHGTVRVRVLRVVDGDTIKVTAGGRSDTVRYIGIDTPEDVKPGVPVACFARAAAARNGALVRGRRVRLRFDSNPRDRYGRMLAYVYREGDGLFVNAALVRAGYARAYPFPDNRAQRALFAGLDTAARAAGRGLWGACGPGANRAFPAR